jgi:hypothetical protein
MSDKREASKFGFELIWCENGNCSDLPDTNNNILFNIRANDLPHNIVALNTAQVTTIKTNALSALQTAFAPYNVQVGTRKIGSNNAYVVGNLALDSCAATEGNNISVSRISVSRVFYPNNMSDAQYAVNQTNGNPTGTLLQAIGEGIGNNAAHEIAHQLKNLFSRFPVVNGMGMDDSSIDTYNGSGCDGSKQPWVYTGFGTDANKTPIHWGDAADQSLMNILGRKP